MPLGSAFAGGNTRDVQIAFDADFAKMSSREKQAVAELLSKKSFNKDDSVLVKKYMEKYRGYLGFNDGETMEEVPLDYSTLDQTTKRNLATEKLYEKTVKESTERQVALAEAAETKRAEKIADLISEFSSNDKGETLANVHTA